MKQVKAYLLLLINGILIGVKYSGGALFLLGLIIFSASLPPAVQLMVVSALILAAERKLRIEPSRVHKARHEVRRGS